MGQGTGVEVAILGPDGDILAAGETGEVAIRGDNVMNGYLNNHEANTNAFANGFLRTGDLGRIDTNGYLTLLGRLKELIKRGGEKISPAQIDDVLLNFTRVGKAAAFGVPDTMYGETVHAAVVANGPLTEEEILDHCREKLPRFMVPVKIHILSELPLGPSGKVSRVTLSKTLGVARTSWSEEFVGRLSSTALIRAGDFGCPASVSCNLQPGWDTNAIPIDCPCSTT